VGVAPKLSVNLELNRVEVAERFGIQRHPRWGATAHLQATDHPADLDWFTRCGHQSQPIASSAIRLGERRHVQSDLELGWREHHSTFGGGAVRPGVGGLARWLGRVTTNGAAMRPRSLAVDVAGEGEALVLIPGGITGWLSWIPHQERLSNRYRTIRVQPIHNELGSAGMKGDPSYTREVAVESLLLTINHLEIDRAHFAGWSAGGKGLLDFAMAHPDRLNSMTLVEPAADWILEVVGESDREHQEATDFLYSLAGQDVTEDQLARVLYIAGFVSDPNRARSDPYWERAWPHHMTLSWLSENLMGSDHSLADLAAVMCPVLLTKGTETGKVERRVVDLLALHLPNARVIELEGSHAHHIESIDRFLEALENHIQASLAT